MAPFHLAIPVHELGVAKEFYLQNFQCSIGRSSKTWIDLNFFEHQLVLHVDESLDRKVVHNPVDGHDVPVPHFGVILKWEQWHDLKDRLIENKISFVIEPHIRFKGQPGEQATMFFYDPSGNALEFKSFKDFSQIFAS